MKFSEYRKLTIRTMSNTGSDVTDSVHMVLGINTEVMGEMPGAIAKEDLVNFKEEVGDAFWYIANYCNIWNIEPTLEIDLSKSKFDSVKLDKSDAGQFMILFTIAENIAELQDLDKKLLAYGKPADLQKRTDLINTIYSMLEYFCHVLGINTDRVRENNIEKLVARYPDLKFDADKAINRTLDTERAILEQE